MITLLTGSPGHGKSYTLIREIDKAVGKGKPVVTNVPLRDDWAMVMARRYVFLGRFRKDAVKCKAEKFSKYVFISNDFEEILRVRLMGEGEGRGKLILDEAHRWMNARGWDNAMNPDGTPMKRGEALAKRLKVINHMSGHRHYGFDAIISTQSDKSIDNQVRELYEFHSEVRNLKRLPWLGFFMRFNLFMRVTKWNDRSRTKAGIDCYWLVKSLANLYHTHSLQISDWPDDPIMLPSSEEVAYPVGYGWSR
jgi:zona occludens toxin (predicted ATPase)